MFLFQQSMLKKQVAPQKQKDYIVFDGGVLYGILASMERVKGEVHPKNSPLLVADLINMVKNGALFVEGDKCYLTKQNYSDIIGQIKHKIGPSNYEDRFKKAFQTAAKVIDQLPKKVLQELNKQKNEFYD